MHYRPKTPDRAGFALIITIVMMALLTILAIAVLNLSTAAIRTAGQGEDMHIARANARVALALAIAELQSSLGPDQAISASAQFVDPDAQVNMTGAWRSHLPTPANPSADPSQRFQTWLVSHPDITQKSNGAQFPQPVGKSVQLVGTRPGMGQQPAEVMQASIIDMVEDGGDVSNGGFAYAVVDESSKARVDLEPMAEGMRPVQGGLSEGDTFGIEAITSGGSIDWTQPSTQNKLLSLESTSLGAPDLQPLLRDLTTSSCGLLTDTARGGLRRDMSSLFNGYRGSLPGGFDDQPLYIDEEAAGADSAPTWNLVADWANSANKMSGGGGGSVSVNAELPRSFRPYTERRGRPATIRLPRNLEAAPLAPVVNRVEMVFSLVARDLHGHWATTVPAQTSSRHQFLLHMIYSPVVTIYNPYNVPISFSSLRMRFADIPIGFNFYINGRALLSEPTPLGQMYVNYEQGGRSVAFYLKLVDQLGTAGGQITLQPGESRIYGTAVLPNFTWANDRPSDGNTIFDWRGDKTDGREPFQLAAGWNGPGVGFDIDWLVPAPFRTAASPMRTAGVVALRSNDRITAEVTPLALRASGNTFTATVELETRRNRFEPAGIFQFNYRSENNLVQWLGDRYQRDISFPFQTQDRRLSTARIYERATTAVREYSRVKPFAIFTLTNKTTLDSGTASAPGLSHPPSTLITEMNAASEDPAIHSFESSLLPVDAAGAGNAGAIEIDPLDRAFSHTGRSAATGVRSFAMYELPQLPPQSVAQIRHANLACTGHFPRFTYTAGESFAHPMIPADRVVVPGAQRYPYLDHSWLANNTLWDSWFFSTLCDYTGPAFAGGSSRNQQQVISEFFSGQNELLNSRLSPRIPNSESPDTIASRLAGDAALFQQAARYLQVEGPFNVNSLSIPAWKTVLASLNGSDVSIYDAIDRQLSTVSGVANPLPRMRQPNGAAVGANSIREQRWTGFRSLNDEEIDLLARSIVEVVRERGPFLSLSEFVNRNPSGQTNEQRMGPLQEAIQRSGINTRLFQSGNAVGALNELDGRDIPIDEVRGDGFAFPEAIAGPNFTGAPGFLTQGDLLSAMGTTPTVRGDTFTVHAYGEARNAAGDVTARAWCEATVQRDYSFVDPTDREETPADQLGSQANQQFGRRFKVVSFRWLSPKRFNTTS